MLPCCIACAPASLQMHPLCCLPVPPHCVTYAPTHKCMEGCLKSEGCLKFKKFDNYCFDEMQVIWLNIEATVKGYAIQQWCSTRSQRPGPRANTVWGWGRGGNVTQPCAGEKGVCLGLSPALQQKRGCGLALAGERGV